MTATPEEESLRTVLIVDDEPDIATSLASLIQAKVGAVKVITASTGWETLALMKTARVDVLVVDYRLGRTNGLELLKELHGLYPDVPALLMTAFPNAKTFAKAVNWGVVKGIYIKPFHDDSLLVAVAELLRKRRPTRRRGVAT